MGSWRGLHRDDALASPRLTYFCGLAVVFACDYLHLLLVIKSTRREIINPDRSISVVPVQVLDELPWRSSLFERAKVLRMTQEIR